MMQCGFCFRAIAVVLAMIGALRAEEEGDELSVSPDKRFFVRKMDDKAGGGFLQVVERKTKRVVLRMPKEGEATVIDSSGFAWAPNGLRLAWNRREGTRYTTTSVYQWKNDSFVELKDPERTIGYSLIEKERAAQLKAAGLAKDVYQRRIVDTWKIKRWMDANTAELLAHSIRAVPSQEGDDLDVWFRFTLAFDKAGVWKVAKTHLLTGKEAEKEEADE